MSIEGFEDDYTTQYLTKAELDDFAAWCGKDASEVLEKLQSIMDVEIDVPADPNAPKIWARKLSTEIFKKTY